jgi:protein-S-isoprenylcysteine O-methyltransferase Ste14
MSVRKHFPDLPPIWTAGFAVALYLVAQFVPVVEFGFPGLNLLAYAVSAAGLALILWSALWFRRKKTTIEPFNRPSSLIVEGPYRINRNPIYLGMFIILLGIALWLGAASAVALCLLFPVIITRRFIANEEKDLREIFGAEAEDYFSKTRRW